MDTSPSVITGQQKQVRNSPDNTEHLSVINL